MKIIIDTLIKKRVTWLTRFFLFIAWEEGADAINQSANGWIKLAIALN